MIGNSLKTVSARPAKAISALIEYCKIVNNTKLLSHLQNYAKIRYFLVRRKQEKKQPSPQAFHFRIYDFEESEILYKNRCT
jgi:hypothetical protein